MRICVISIYMILAFIAAPALAETKGRPKQCGVPEESQLETDPAMDFCDIYARQLAYHDTQQDFRSLIEERRKNYVIPRNMAYDAYRKKIQKERYPDS